MTKIILTSVTLIICFWWSLPAMAADNAVITEVTLDKTAFNPSRDESVTIHYKLSKPAKVTVQVYDPDGGLVRTLIKAVQNKKGANQSQWDGKDFNGKPVPNEAYTFTIETDSGEVHDPTTYSGGIVGDITEADFDREAGTVVYRLPEASRVLIRLGIKNGPMLKTLVDWDPRVVGSITEYWDGRDENKVTRFRDNKDFSALITYVTLPDTTVIAYGNDGETYREYKFGRGKDRPQKPERAKKPDPEGRLRPENLVPPAWARSPRVVMTFPKLDQDKKDIPEVKDTVDVHLDVEASDRDYLQREQFEIIFYVDNVFFAEAERGFLPFNWRWELNQIPEGEHILTVNISSFRGQVGVGSRKVHIVKKEEKK